MACVTNVRRFLPGVPGREIERIYRKAPGNEIERGKFDNPESSAALAANTFGYFLGQAEALPRLPGGGVAGPVVGAGGDGPLPLVRWEASRSGLPDRDLLLAHRRGIQAIRTVQGQAPRLVFRCVLATVLEKRHEGLRERAHRLREDGRLYDFIDAAQLVKHAFALRTESRRRGARRRRLVPTLFYLYAEPRSWPTSGKPIRSEGRAGHREEIADFAGAGEGDEVGFVSRSYSALLDGWMRRGSGRIRAHARAVRSRCAP